VADHDVADIKRALSDPTRVLEALGMMGQGKARQRQSGGWMIRCPVHVENSPSCSVQQKDGVILWRCWGCDERGDVLHLVAAAHGMKVEHDFKRILIEAARLGGLWHIVDKLEGREVPREAPAMPSPMQAPAAPPEPPREWPPQAEVDALWAACGRTANDPEVAAYLEGRAISPELVDELDLARVLPADGPIPWWAGYKGDADLRRPWRAIGYKLIVPMYSAIGVMRSVRAWRVIDVDIGPSRLPAGGHKAGELVMADAIGLAMLRGEEKPYFVTIVEGEPDFLSRAIVTSDAKTATIGIINGSWTKEFAERFPFAAKVAIRTDLDKAGDRYADQILATLRRRCFPRRLQA